MSALDWFHFYKSDRLLLISVLSDYVSNGSKSSGFEMAGSGSLDINVSWHYTSWDEYLGSSRLVVFILPVFMNPLFCWHLKWYLDFPKVKQFKVGWILDKRLKTLSVYATLISFPE